jgi:hypothetical protein
MHVWDLTYFNHRNQIIPTHLMMTRDVSQIPLTANCTEETKLFLNVIILASEV